MFDVGWPELLVILAVALLIFGPERMVDLARTAGKALGEFRKITSELSSGLTDVLKEETPRRAATEKTPSPENTPTSLSAQPPVSAAPLTIPPPASTPSDEYDSAEPTMPHFPVEPEPVAGEPPIDEPNDEPNAPAEA
jgi:TatA/E family protein of Tat protein translocase